MINGAHAIVSSKNPDADRDFFRDVLELPSVDVGGGWLIFGLPPSEVAVHPSKKNDVHELYLMCDDIELFIAQMRKKKIACGPVSNQGWGLLTQLTLPGGGKLGVYQPRHARPNSTSVAKRPKPPAKRSVQRSAKKRGGKPEKQGSRKR